MKQLPRPTIFLRPLGAPDYKAQYQLFHNNTQVQESPLGI